MTIYKEEKIAFASSHPIQYQVPIFKRISKKKNSFYAIFGCEINSSTKMFDKEFKKNITWGKDLQKGFNFISFNKNYTYLKNIYKIFNFLKNKKITIIIVSGWDSNFYKLIIIIAKILKIKIILRCENNLYNEKNLKKYLKIFVYSILFKLFYKFIAIGKKNIEMYLRCGVDRRKIFLAPYCVDDQFFSGKKILKSKFLPIKKEINKKKAKIFLFVGKIINRKGYKDLMKISLMIKNNTKLYNNSIFLIIGTGDKLNEIKNFMKDNEIINFKFLGFKSQKDLVYYYKIADYLLLPSLYETWGLVVNEAMSVGTPCVVSNNCGCANDLVISGMNGFTYDAGNCKELFKIIKNIILKNSLHNKIKKNVKISISNFNIKKTVDLILNIK